MVIGPDETLVGYPKRKIRDVLTKGIQGREEVPLEWIQKILELEQEPALELAKKLESKGLIQIWSTPRKDRGFWKWKLTDSGRRLAKAKDNYISREKADKNIRDFLRSVEQVNANQNFAFRVEWARVFGSYFTDKEQIGDVDIGIKLVPRFESSEEQARLVKAREQYAEFELKLGQADDIFAFPSNEINDYLKEKCPDIDLLPESDVPQEPKLYKEIYPY